MDTPIEVLIDHYGCKTQPELQAYLGDYISLTMITEAMEIYGKQCRNEAILKASEVVQEPYLKSGMTNTANRAKKAVLNLIKSNG